MPSTAPFEHEILSAGRRCSVTKQYQMYTATGLYKIVSCEVCSYPVFKALRRTCSRHAVFFYTVTFRDVSNVLDYCMKEIV